MPTADNDGIDIGYEVTGAETGETVVFVSGLGYGRWLWEWQRPAVEDDYRVVLWDLRGIGESDAPEGPYTMSEMAGDLEAVLADAGVEAAHIVGISLGGMLTQRYAIDYDRAKSLTLLSTGPGGDERVDPAPEVTDRILNPPEDVSLRENIRYKMRPAFTEAFWDERQDVVDRILDYRTADPVSDEVRNWQAAGVAAFDVVDELDAVSVPALVMHGERDQVVPVENGRRLASLLPDADLVTYDEGGSHLFPIERDEAVNERLREFLADPR